MNTPIYFDSHTSFIPFKELESFLYRPKLPHAFSSFHQTKEKRAYLKAVEEDVYRLLGLEGFATLFIQQDYMDVLQKIAFEHYFHHIFPSGKQHVLLLCDRVSTEAVWEPYKALGVFVEKIIPSTPLVSVEILKGLITPRTTLVSIPWVNPLTGVVQPIEELALFCKEKGIAFHVDVSHVIGKKYFSMKDLDVNYLSFECKPFHGPWDVAVGIYKKKERVDSLFDERLVPLKEALYFANEHIDDYHLEIARHRLLFEKKLQDEIPESQIIYQGVEKIPSVSLIEFPLCVSEAFLAYLSKKHIFPSCGEKDLRRLKNVLTERGCSVSVASCALSFYFPYSISEENIVDAIERIKCQYEKIRQFTKEL